MAYTKQQGWKLHTASDDLATDYYQTLREEEVPLDRLIFARGQDAVAPTDIVAKKYHGKLFPGQPFVDTPRIQNITSVIQGHEVSELYVLNIAKRKKRFGSHTSIRVIRDELALAERMGTETLGDILTVRRLEQQKIFDRAAGKIPWREGVLPKQQRHTVRYARKMDEILSSGEARWRKLRGIETPPSPEELGRVLSATDEDWLRLNQKVGGEVRSPGAPSGPPTSRLIPFIRRNWKASLIGAAAIGGFIALNYSRTSSAIDVPEQIDFTEQQRRIFTHSLNSVSIPKENRGLLTINGMPHGGLAEVGRKANTPFGSKYDRMRAIADMLGISFESLIKRKGFKRALRKGEFIQEIGEGAFGTVSLYRGKYKGQEFDFVKKTIKQEARDLVDSALDPNKWRSSLNLQHEAKFLKSLGAETHGVPSFYGTTNNALFMEYMPGKLVGSLVHKNPGFDLPAKAKTYLHEDIEYLAEKRVLQPDIHGGNVLFDEKSGRVSLIDFGAAKSNIVRGEALETMREHLQLQEGLGAVNIRSLSSRWFKEQQLKRIQDKNRRRSSISSLQQVGSIVTPVPPGLRPEGLAEVKRSSISDFKSPKSPAWQGLFGGISRKIAKFMGKRTMPGAGKLLDPIKAAKMAQTQSVEEFVSSLGGDIFVAGHSRMSSRYQPWVEGFEKKGIAAGYQPTPKDPLLRSELPEGLVYVDPAKTREQWLKKASSIGLDTGLAKKAIESDDFLKTILYHETLERQATARFGDKMIMATRKPGAKHQAGQVILGEAGFIESIGNQELKRVFTAIRKTPVEHKTFMAGLEAFKEVGVRGSLRKLTTDFEDGYRGLNSVSKKIANQAIKPSATESLNRSSVELKKTQKQIWEWGRSGGRGHLRYTNQSKA